MGHRLDKKVNERPLLSPRPESTADCTAPSAAAVSLRALVDMPLEDGNTSGVPDRSDTALRPGREEENTAGSAITAGSAPCAELGAEVAD